MKIHRKIGNDIRIVGFKPNGNIRNYVLSFSGLKGIKLPKVGGKSQIGDSTIKADLNFTLYYREPKGTKFFFGRTVNAVGLTLQQGPDKSYAFNESKHFYINTALDPKEHKDKIKLVVEVVLKIDSKTTVSGGYLCTNLFDLEPTQDPRNKSKLEANLLSLMKGSPRDLISGAEPK